MKNVPLAVTVLLIWVAVSPASLTAQRMLRHDAERIDRNGSTDRPRHATRIEPRGGPGTFSVVYDDGEADSGYGANADAYDIVMRFDLPVAPVRVEEVTVCFSREGSDPDLEFDLTFWDADGAGGRPGTLLDVVQAIAEDVSPDLAGTYYTYDLSDLDVVLEGTTRYIGVGWEPVDNDGFFLCGDYDRVPPQPAFDMLDLDGVWEDVASFDPSYTALRIRGLFSELEPSDSPCTADAETLCLTDNRFEVKASWRSASEAGEGQAVELTADTGYFWFFDPANVEVVVKVLDACTVPPGRFWVFSSGLTNVEVELAVTDTLTGQVRTYLNPLDTPFQPIQDTNAFATCP